MRSAAAEGRKHLERYFSRGELRLTIVQIAVTRHVSLARYNGVNTPFDFATTEQQRSWLPVLMTTMRRLLLAVLLACVSGRAAAALSLPPMYSSNMVLQRVSTLQAKRQMVGSLELIPFSLSVVGDVHDDMGLCCCGRQNHTAF